MCETGRVCVYSIWTRVTKKYIFLKVLLSFFLPFTYRTTEICHQIESSSVYVSFCISFVVLLEARGCLSVNIYLLVSLSTIVCI